MPNVNQKSQESQSKSPNEKIESDNSENQYKSKPWNQKFHDNQQPKLQNGKQQYSRPHPYSKRSEILEAKCKLCYRPQSQEGNNKPQSEQGNKPQNLQGSGLAE